MSVQTLVASIAQNVQGYGGYQEMETRKDSMDVFITYVEGRLIKRIKVFEKQLSVWETSPEFIEKAAAMDELLAGMQKIMLQLKDDLTQIQPFMGEYYISEESVLHDLVRIDNMVLTLENRFSKMTENLVEISPALLGKARETAGNIQFLLTERTRRIQALNGIFKTIAQFLENLNNQVTAVDLKKYMMDHIDVLLNHYPDRIQTFEQVIQAFKNQLDTYGNFSDAAWVKEKAPALQLYMERYPALLGSLEHFLTTFQPRSPAEEKSRSLLQEVIASRPDFSALSGSLQEALHVAAKNAAA